MTSTGDNPQLIITRPEPYAQQLEQALHAEFVAQSNQLATNQINTLRMPLIRFTNNNSLNPQTLKNALAHADIAIFISQQAVDYALHPSHSIDKLPPRIIAVGASTQQRLANYGIQATCPQQSNSEGLIALLQASSDFANAHNKTVCLVRGNKGRPLLERFIKQHFQLQSLEVYQREILNDARLGSDVVHHFHTNRKNALLATSGQLLELGVRLLKNAKLSVKDFSIISGSDRISTMAHHIGFQHCYTAQSANNLDLVKACQQWLAQE